MELCIFTVFFFKLSIFKNATDENELHAKWTKFRKLNLTIVENPFFEAFIMLIIFGSSLALTFEDVNLKTYSTSQTVLNAFDYFFTLVFIGEMFLKWFGNGFKKYFTDPWSVLDFVIVIVSCIWCIFAILFLN